MSATRRPVPARALSGLERWLGEWAAAEGVTAGRLRRFVAVAVVAAMVQRARDDEGRPLFLLKGGSASSCASASAPAPPATSTPPSAVAARRRRRPGVGHP